MHPSRLLLLLFSFIFFPILLTIFSFVFSSPRVTSPTVLAGRTNGFHALFSFNIPSSLFPPSAIISLTEDNSTFFLARPAAFGPSLPSKGLSGQLWVGSGFGDGVMAAKVEGELGCSDIPGWGENDNHLKQDKSIPALGKVSEKSSTEPLENPSRNRRRSDTPNDLAAELHNDDLKDTPSLEDGTDDHLHHPLPGSPNPVHVELDQSEDRSPSRQPAHADIQSLQESAEIAGKIVLLSRGGCGFLEKVKWAQRRGGIAVIVGDNARSGGLVTMYARGDTSNVTIPSIFTSYTTAHLLSSLIPSQNMEDADSSKLADTNKRKPTKERLQTTTSTAAAPMLSPTTVLSGMSQHDISQSGYGPIGTILSFLGIWGGPSRFHSVSEDRHRPPNSGNIDWILMDTRENELDDTNAQTARDQKAGQEKPDNKAVGFKSYGPQPTSAKDDGFVIGVHDWRDPDLIPPRSSSASQTSSTPKRDSDKSQENLKTLPTGGIITPGSGEYHTLQQVGDSKKGSAGKILSPREISAIENPDGSSVPERGWFSRHFGWSEETALRSGQSAMAAGPEAEVKASSSDKQSSPDTLQEAEHEGLWVTLTPTSMSTSPFLDTLLVLVVSPLLTLSLVYGLLLIRSRIRRRRWRAPKSLVDRLPVRTYHTISPPSSTSYSSRSPSPGPPSSTSPLLGTGRRRLSQSRSPSQTTSGIFIRSHDTQGESANLRGEKKSSVSNSWRRKYTGKQVECVVCLEEYVDGQSRVMSLPCGHEFHAECIVPWLTTRRRTCPICKGDVVRSLADERHETRHSSYDGPANQLDRNMADTAAAASTPVNITSPIEDESSDLEAPEEPGVSFRQSLPSVSRSSWRDLASLSLSALSGDTVWNEPRNDRTR